MQREDKNQRKASKLALRYKVNLILELKRMANFAVKIIELLLKENIATGGDKQLRKELEEKLK